MLGELGRKADAGLRRGTDAVVEAAHATVVHTQRIAAAVTGAATRIAREAKDLVWNYRDVAADLRRPTDRAPRHDEVETKEEPVRPVLRVVGSDE